MEMDVRVPFRLSELHDILLFRVENGVQCAGDTPKHFAQCKPFLGSQIVERGAMAIEDDDEPAENLGWVPMFDNPVWRFEDARGVRQGDLATNRAA